MKLRLLILFLSLFNLLSAQKPSQKWLDQKFSMFIHFGLYSLYGGIYDEKPITRGYSEQIQSFAGIFSDWYGNSSKKFNPSKWDADAIVALAKEAGMRSIVFTSKHHDGFCMYHSQYTDFNIVDATPYNRDLMKELSDACRLGGIDFAVYFSLIDWHFPQAYPISSHNADPVTPEHYQFNLKQVEEIMTHYGNISEIWFDMGSLTPEQSKGLYNLVNRLQPNCMISGRLGNNYVDFSVMADNEYPEYQMITPWQTAASMFDETWGYRSWQERGSVDEKVAEKLKSLIQVISHGGNYLLNIGPRGDGSVVEFEQEVLQKMGKWTTANAEAIYGTRGNPLPQTTDWGGITTKENCLYLFVNKDYPESIIQLQGISGKIKSAKVLATNQSCNFWYLKNVREGYAVEIPKAGLDEFQVVKVEFESGFDVIPNNIIKKRQLTATNASPGFGHSSLDYYCGYKSLVSYNWTFESRKKSISPIISFTENELGKKIILRLDGEEKEISLYPSSKKTELKKSSGIKWGNLYTKAGQGVFGTLKEENKGIILPANAKWEKVDNFKYGLKLDMPLAQRRSVLFLQEIETPSPQNAAIEIGSGNGVYILLNGKYITAHCLPTRTEYQKEIVILPLQKGKNQLLIKYFNRFADQLNYSIKPLEEWRVYQISLDKIRLNNEKVHQLSIKDAKPDSKVSPLRMNNIEIKY